MEEDWNMLIIFFFSVWKSVGPCESNTPGGTGFVTEQLSYEGNSTILEERESECNVNPVEGNAEKWRTLIPVNTKIIWFIFTVPPGSIELIRPSRVFHGDNIDLVCKTGPSYPSKISSIT